MCAVCSAVSHFSDVLDNVGYLPCGVMMVICCGERLCDGQVGSRFVLLFSRSVLLAIP